MPTLPTTSAPSTHSAVPCSVKSLAGAAASSGWPSQSMMRPKKANSRASKAASKPDSTAITPM